MKTEGVCLGERNRGSGIRIKLSHNTSQSHESQNAKMGNFNDKFFWVEGLESRLSRKKEKKGESFSFFSRDALKPSLPPRDQA
jgi:hypothetical protein